MESKRDVLERIVRETPGMSFSQLKQKTGFCNGVLQYHLGKAPRIEKVKGGYVLKGHCATCEFQGLCNESCVLKELHKDSTKTILEKLSQGKSQAEIARDLGLKRSTVNYHVQKLREMSVVEGSQVIRPEVV